MMIMTVYLDAFGMIVLDPQEREPYILSAVIRAHQ